jgi:nucleoside-diphosphate-sugar epimerase
MNVFVFGMGYSSRAAARALREQIDPELAIAGTTRSGEKSETPGLEKVTAHLFDGNAPGPAIDVALGQATHIIHSIAPGADGDPVVNHHRNDLKASNSLQWLCYYSTVGVYGNFDGAWIDETATCAPGNQRSQWRVKAEADWRTFAAEKNLPLMILRLAGIYGSGRSALDKLQAGTARRINKPGQVFNRIHVEDIGRVTALAALQKVGGTFNLADDEPAPPQDLVTYAANLLKVTPPPETPFERADMTEMARSFYGDNKRVSNARIKRALEIELLYPTYREGLTAINGRMT